MQTQVGHFPIGVLQGSVRGIPSSPSPSSLLPSQRLGPTWGLGSSYLTVCRMCSPSLGVLKQLHSRSFASSLAGLQG